VNSIPVPISIHNARHDGVSVGARAYYEKEDEQEGLEIEECGLQTRFPRKAIC
jgi:hypothetical protein